MPSSIRAPRSLNLGFLCSEAQSSAGSSRVQLRAGQLQTSTGIEYSTVLPIPESCCLSSGCSTLSVCQVRALVDKS